MRTSVAIGPFFDRARETASRDDLRQEQLRRIRSLVGEILPSNRFYRDKLGAVGFNATDDLRTIDDVRALPFTLKQELVEAQSAAPPFGTNLTFPPNRYVKLHQTSGSSGGQPLRVLDTAESWQWWLRCWAHVFTAAGVTHGDRVFCAFSFGPFIGFWAAHEAAVAIGAMAIPGGGQDSLQRLRTIGDSGATVLLSTPTYALRLAEVAREHGIDPSSYAIRTTIHAGEPGASIPATRRRLEEDWGAECHDHTGASEVGATGFTCRARAGVHLIESEFLFEVIDPDSGEPVPTGSPGELVVTNFGRVGMPVIRYRTGDIVQLAEAPCSCGRTWARLDGGILGRADDMVIVRGINVFPSSIEDVVHEFSDVAEFRLELFEERQMPQLRLMLEPAAHVGAESGAHLVSAVCDEIQRRLFLRIACEAVAPNALPRFDLKARRLIRRTGAGPRV